MPTNHVQIIKELGGITAVSQTLRVEKKRVEMWRHRRRIPRGMWPELIEAYPSLSIETLKATERAA